MKAFYTSGDETQERGWNMMTSDLLTQLSTKVEDAVAFIHFLRLQIESLEEENIGLKAEREQWKHELSALIKRLDHIHPASIECLI